MLEITGNDIAALNDEDLRDLVGRLCEAELHSHGLSTSAVTWGGNQNAADGGIDVRITIADGASPGGFVPRQSVGYQVKKTDFTPGLISREMCPSGELRPSISGLIDDCGAYIIACSGSDTSDSALIARIEAMRSAVANQDKHADLHIDFYDQNRLATWTRSHPGLVVWVRQKIGRGISGWQPYSSWAVSPDGVEDEYLLDDKARLHVGVADEKGVGVIAGIDRIRNILRADRGVVRLAGLSGVGKTRLVQSLFDERVGNNPLDPASVVYTDMNDNPSPQPTGMISDLVASRTRMIVVIDNCAPDLHRRITEACRSSDSRISVITIEYDVQEDEPEGTEVFRLEPSSVELVSKLIERRFPEMTDHNIEKIAEFSGGNARVALALANTLERHESVAGLQDEELFKRLFHQRQALDDSLLKAAQACSLLYSFQGEAISGNEAELPKIAALVGMNAQQLFAKVAQLKQRDLVQSRSVWRAILPHAIANRLAKMALREIPLAQIEGVFDTERLLRSFSRRLGHLHESREARCIAEKWLAAGGLLSEVSRLTEFGFAMFDNIAPVSPESTLAAIERTLRGPNATDLIEGQHRARIGTLLYLIAYDAALFDRSVEVMIQLALYEQMDRSHPNRSALESLFYVDCSGTHATIEQRAGIANDLLRSVESKKHELGLHILEVLLQPYHSPTGQTFEFGARVRDYGYYPDSPEECAHWFSTVLRLARQFASKPCQSAAAIRSMIAKSIQSIWFLGLEVQEQFEAIADDLATRGYWQEGWIAVQFVLSHPPDEVDATAMQRLRTFEGRLRPRTVYEQVSAVVLTSRAFDVASVDEVREVDPKESMAPHEKAYNTAEELGRRVSSDHEVFAALLPDLVSANGSRMFPFGRGLALGCADHRSIWTHLTRTLATTDEGKRNLDVVTGFLNGLSTVNYQLSEEFLEAALSHEILGVLFPILQFSVLLSPAGVDRLKRSAVMGKVRAGTFQGLAWGSRSDAVTGDDLRTIVRSLAQLDDGFSVATEILAMRFQSAENQKQDYVPELIDAGRTLLSQAGFSDFDISADYRLAIIAKACLPGADGSVVARSLCIKIKDGIRDHTFRCYHYGQFLHTIFSLQPRVALDVFFGESPPTDGNGLEIIDFGHTPNRRQQPIDGVSPGELLRWCDEQPAERYPAVSKIVTYQAATTNGTEWTPLALQMLRRAPDPVAVLGGFVRRFYPRGWSGSRAAIVESRLDLLDRLGELNNTLLDDYAARTCREITANVARMRENENKDDSRRDERFE